MSKADNPSNKTKTLDLSVREEARQWALPMLQKIAEDEQATPSARVQAIALVMKHHGLLGGDVNSPPADERTAEELTSELEEKLVSLLGEHDT